MKIYGASIRNCRLLCKQSICQGTVGLVRFALRFSWVKDVWERAWYFVVRFTNEEANKSSPSKRRYEAGG